MSVQNVIRRARLSKGLSQAELGRRVGVTRAAVSDWEAGKTAPKRRRAPKVAEVLGLSLAQLNEGLARYEVETDVTGFAEDRAREIAISVSRDV